MNDVYYELIENSFRQVSEKVVECTICVIDNKKAMKPMKSKKTKKPSMQRNVSAVVPHVSPTSPTIGLNPISPDNSLGINTELNSIDSNTTNWEGEIINSNVAEENLNFNKESGINAMENQIQYSVEENN